MSPFNFLPLPLSDCATCAYSLPRFVPALSSMPSNCTGSHAGFFPASFQSRRACGTRRVCRPALDSCFTFDTAAFCSSGDRRRRRRHLRAKRRGAQPWRGPDWHGGDIQTGEIWDRLFFVFDMDLFGQKDLELRFGLELWLDVLCICFVWVCLVQSFASFSLRVVASLCDCCFAAGSGTSAAAAGDDDDGFSSLDGCVSRTRNF